MIGPGRRHHGTTSDRAVVSASAQGGIASASLAPTARDDGSDFHHVTTAHRASASGATQDPRRLRQGHMSDAELVLLPLPLPMLGQFAVL
jgi:hypothetical protein